MPSHGLGSGLDFLYNENADDHQSTRMLRLSEIEPNEEQPRHDFDPKMIEALAQSIAQHGVLQPLLVRPHGLNYQIIAGERRWRAANMAGLHEVPAIVLEMSDETALEIALIENLQRENLNPIEEANGYRQLIDRFHMKQEEVAKRVGRSRSAITNALRLLQLPKDVCDMVENEDLAPATARLLLSIDNPTLQQELAEQAVDKNMTTRQLDKKIRDIKDEEKEENKPKSTPDPIDSYFTEIKLGLENTLGRRVSVKVGEKNHGVITLEFYDKDDLATIADKLSRQ